MSLQDQLGITGHREIGNPDQERALRNFLTVHPNYTVGRHGACAGIDEMSHGIMRASGLRVVVHPPLKARHRMNLEPLQKDKGVIILPPLEYAERDEQIVVFTRTLMAFPLFPEKSIYSKHSGTWLTVRIARRYEREIWICRPDGSIVPDISCR